MPSYKVLIVEDEPAIADTIQYALEVEGIQSIWSATAASANKELVATTFDAIILDVGLPDKNGFDLCREWKPLLKTPILFLTAREDVIDRVVGLELGADDYMTKPFSPRELTARIKVIFRRASEVNTESLVVKETHLKTELFVVKEEECQILYEGNLLDLSKHEYEILQTLIRRPQKVFSREELMMQAWDEPESSMDRTIDVHIKNLRKKLKSFIPQNDPIRTHRGLGYSLQSKVL